MMQILALSILLDTRFYRSCPPLPLPYWWVTGSQWIQPESSEAYKTAYNLPMGDAGTKLDLYYPFFLTVQARGKYTLLLGPGKEFRRVTPNFLI